MKTTVSIEVDLLQARPFRIDGAVYVTFPANGPLDAVTVCFSSVTKQSLRLTLDARERNARKLEQRETKAIEEWQATRGIDPRKARQQLDLEREKDNG